jgi:hypothetical protein
MKSENLAEFSDEQLVQEYKKIKTNKIIDAFIIGITIGIFFYSVVENGFGFFTFFPVIIGYLLIKNSSNSKLFEKEMMKEMKSRNFNQNK